MQPTFMPLFNGDKSQTVVSMGGSSLAVNAGWFRGGDERFRPSRQLMYATDAVEKHILDGWLPKEPFITKSTKLVTFGSCFAGNIARYLAGAGYDLLTQSSAGEKSSQTFVIACNEGIVNPFTMRQLVEWIYEGKTPKAAVWHDYGASAFEFTPERHEQARRIFDAADVFVITVGLSEVWYDKVTGEIFTKGVPRAAYDPERHGFRNTTVQENLDNLRTVYATLRKHRPDAKVIFTLSPVPLVATFRPVSCITANAVSKATLRVAVDELVRELAADGAIHYWPSYEIVTEAFTGAFGSDNRHVKTEILDFIMTCFERFYCAGQDVSEKLAERYFKALVSSGELPVDTERLIETRNETMIRYQAANLARRQMYSLALMLLEAFIARHPDADLVRKTAVNVAAQQAREEQLQRQRIEERRRKLAEGAAKAV